MKLRISKLSDRKVFLSLTIAAVIITSFVSPTSFVVLNAHAEGHDLPASDIGDRKAEAKNFEVQYQDITFNVNVSSPSTVEKVILNPENKQLVIRYPSEEWQHFDDFQVYVDIPNELMSGPFVAVFNGMDLQVSEEEKDDKTITLILNGTHLDVMQMNDTSESMDGMDRGNNNSSQQQNSIVITATNVVPEFPLALPVAATAIAAAIMLAGKVKSHPVV